MTADEFNQWKNTSMHPSKATQLQEASRRQLFRNQQDVRRLAEEQYEALRRRKVLDGEWTD